MQIMTAVLHPSTMHQGECGKGFIQKTWIHSGSCNHQLYLPLAFSSPDLHKGSAFSFSQAPDPLTEHSAAVAHLSASFLHRRVSVKLGKIWKRFQRKPSVLNIEEQSLPLSASYLLPNLVNLTLLCSKLSVSPGHTADSRSCPSGPASLFLQRCHLASCSQNGKPIQRARLPLSLPSHSACSPFFQIA